MNEIRLNKEAEKEIVRAKFKVPPIIVFCFVFFFVFMFLPFLGITVMAFLSSIDYLIGIMLPCVIITFILLLFMLIIPMIKIKKSKCIITNKRIYGVTSSYYITKRFSYKMGDITDVEIITIRGAHQLLLKCSPGGVFTVFNVKNVNQLYDKLSEMLTTLKNDKDLMVDIEMSKIDAENKKAAAFERIATNMSGASQHRNAGSQNYIEELKGLKELLDSGIISKEEFEEKKKNLLNKS